MVNQPVGHVDVATVIPRGDSLDQQSASTETLSRGTGLPTAWRVGPEKRTASVEPCLRESSVAIEGRDRAWLEFRGTERRRQQREQDAGQRHADPAADRATGTSH